MEPPFPKAYARMIRLIHIILLIMLPRVAGGYCWIICHDYLFHLQLLAAYMLATIHAHVHTAHIYIPPTIPSL